MHHLFVLHSSKSEIAAKVFDSLIAEFLDFSDTGIGIAHERAVVMEIVIAHGQLFALIAPVLDAVGHLAAFAEGATVLQDIHHPVQARLGVLACLFRCLGDIEIAEEGYVRHGDVQSGLRRHFNKSFAQGESGVSILHHRGAKVVAQRDDILQRRLRAGSSDIDRRVRLLHRRRDQVQLVDTVVIARKREFRCRPQALDDFNALLETFLTVLGGDIEPAILVTPRPKPTSSRPPLMWSTVAVSSARRIGLWSVGTMTPVASRIVLVRAAAALATTIDEDPRL